VSPAVQRATKSTRLGPDEVALLQAVLAALPQFGSESELLAESTRRGLLILAGEALISGAEVAGFDPRTLAQRLRVALLPALELLTQQDALPAMLGVARAMPRVEVSGSGGPPTIAPTAAADVASFGSGFLDDDD
jgi:hypothetical protein